MLFLERDLLCRLGLGRGGEGGWPRPPEVAGEAGSETLVNAREVWGSLWLVDHGFASS